MPKSTKILVLDIEGMSGKRPYDIGFIVADKKGAIYEEYSLACLPCIWENLSTTFITSQERVKEMTHKNIEEILRSPNKYEWYTIEKVLGTLENVITRHKISEIWAYNCTFDKSGITKLLEGNENICPNLCKVTWLDIWSAIVLTRCCTKKYVKYCRKNDFVTDKGNIKTSAEVVYSYLIGEKDFEEEHTGHADCLIEYQILMTAFKSKKKIDGTIANPWRLVKNFVEENGI